MAPTNPYESPETSAQESSAESQTDLNAPSKFFTRLVEYIIVLLLLIAVLGMFAAFVFGGEWTPPQ